MVDIDRDNWGIDLSAILIYLGSLLRYLFTNLDSWVHSITGLIALAFISFRFYVALKKYYSEKALSNPDSKTNLKKLVNSIVLDNDDETVNNKLVKSNDEIKSNDEVKPINEVKPLKKRKELKNAKKEE